MNTDTKSFSGSYLLFRKDSNKLARPRGSKPRPPKFRHQSFDAAETEAKRLLDIHPDSTFVILQEVARVKRAEVADG